MPRNVSPAPRIRWHSIFAAVLVCVAAADWQPPLWATRPAQEPAPSSEDYLPLQVGNRWELRSAALSASMALEVVGRDGDGFIVRWENPWVTSTFRFEDDGERIRMTGLDMGNGMGPIPSDTVYWDFSRRQGDRWTSPVGTHRITARGERGTTPAGPFEDAVEVETRNPQGQSMYWTFAPGLGLVRFGQGRDAFLLQSRRRGAEPSIARAPAPTPASRSERRVLIGIDPNPPANRAIDDTARRRSFRSAVAVSMGFHYVLPNWNSIERDAGRFTFDDIDLQVSMADEARLPVALNVRVLDAGQRAMPRAYTGWNLDDPRMAERLIAVLRATAPRFKNRVRWITLGNEVDSYFNSRRSDITRYARLLEAVTPEVRALFPGAPLSVNFTAGAAAHMERYRSILDRIDVVSFSYYPLNPDFTMRAPSAAGDDIRGMVEAAQGKDVLFQEIGYASASRLNSSEAKQAEFLQQVFAALSAHASRVVHARILFMSDLPQPVVDSLASYYKAPHSENFKAYLETLGLFDQQGRPKLAWRVFEREAKAFAQGR